ncbi:MAG: flavin reductase family protein [Candidatus Bathyarchaeia archaeon]|nr:flavin reductase family protein [Candidatus Bathyarchaeota archaeon]
MILEDVFRYTDKVYNHLYGEGLLLGSVSKGGAYNLMTIGWGFLGIIWRKPCFIVAVRPSRYTHRLIEETNVFTVNVLPKGMEHIASYCGSVSGREHDKLSELKIKASRGVKVDAPVIHGCPIVYECIVRYRFKLDRDKIPRDVMVIAYPSDDFHTLYLGEIVYMHVDNSMINLL